MILNNLNPNKGLVKNLLFVPLTNSGQLKKVNIEQHNTTALTELLDIPVQDINDTQSLSADNRSFLESTMTIQLSL